MTGQASPRRLRVHILRYNPAEPEKQARIQTYEVDEADGMTLFILLSELREKQDPSLQFDFVCRAGVCGSCGMVVNGRPGLACRTLTAELPADITLAPLPTFELIGDLSVNTGKWMREMSERLETWVHLKQQEVDLRKHEEKTRATSEPMPTCTSWSATTTACSVACPCWPATTCARRNCRCSRR
jgi:fumarate reductase iron-sulfur subunit